MARGRADKTAEKCNLRKAPVSPRCGRAVLSVPERDDFSRARLSRSIFLFLRSIFPKTGVHFSGLALKHASNVCCLAAAFALLIFAGIATAEDMPGTPAYTDRPPPRANEYVFGIHPMHAPAQLFSIYGPIADYLSAHIPDSHFRFETARSYPEFKQKLYSGKFHFAVGNAVHTINALRRGYHVFGKMGDDENNQGLIIVRRDSRIEQLSDLKGKKVSYPARSNLAATIATQFYMHSNGLDVNRDIENVYVGSQESVILNVYHGLTAAGGTWSRPWRMFGADHPKEIAELVVKWQATPMLVNGLLVRNDVPADVRGKVASLLLALHESNEGRVLMARIPLSRFEAADDASFDPVRDYLERFSIEVRPLSD